MIFRQNFFKLLTFVLCISIMHGLQNLCEIKESSSIIDISTAKILKTTVYQYKIENFDNPTNVSQNNKGQLQFTGNFSRLTLLNKALKKQYVYYGKQITIRIPSTYLYAKNKTAEAQMQIIFYLQGDHQENKYKVLSMVQLYLTTTFSSKIQIRLCKEINQKFKNGTVLKLSKLMKIIDKTPVLMYQGTKEFYPCRNDILCMVRKQFALVSQEDLSCLVQKMNITNFTQQKVTRFNQKSLLEVSQMPITGKNNDL